MLIHQSIYQQCLDKLVAGAKSLRQGAPLEGDPTAVDAGALALPGLLQNIDSLVQDAVSQGAQVTVNSFSNCLSFGLGCGQCKVFVSWQSLSNEIECMLKTAMEAT